MNDENLVSLATRPQRERTAIAKMGGKVRSPAKKWAARLRSLKKKGLTNENYKRIYEVMTERESFVFDSYMRLQTWLKECSDIREKAIIEKLIQDVLKNIHGTNDKNQLNIQANDSNVIINIIKPDGKPRDKLETES